MDADMTSAVTQVQAFKALDGTVHATFLAANRRNIEYLCEGMWGEEDYDDQARNLASLLKDSGRKQRNRDFLERLVKELS